MSNTTPENAYADAPSIISEIAWVADQAAYRALGDQVGRDFWLRKAAVLDRIALVEEATYAPGVAAGAIRTAEKAAVWLADHDRKDGPPADRSSYRAYVRREYLTWVTAGITGTNS